MRYRLFYCFFCLWCLSIATAAAGQKTWRELPPLAFDGAVENTAINDTGILYISMDNRVYKSVDNGKSWTTIGEDRISGDITDIGTFPGKPNVVIVSTSTGIYWSLNGGGSWSWDRFEVNPHTGMGGGVGSVHAHPESNRVFAGSYIMSLSGGWQRTHPEKFTSYYAFLSGGTVLSIAGNYQTAEIMKTDNGGTSWTTLSTLPGMGPLFVDGGGRVYAFTERYIMTDSSTVLEANTLLSDDRGATWKPFTVGTTGLPSQMERLRILAIDPATNNVYASVQDHSSFQAQGIYVSSDTMKTWRILDASFSDTQPYEMAFLEDGTLLFATDNQGITSYNASRTPAVQSLNNGLVSTESLTLFAGNTGRLFALGTANGKIKYTDNDGTSWSTVQVYESEPQIRTIARLPNGELLLGSIYSQHTNYSPLLYRSSDNGASWTPDTGTTLIEQSANWTAIESFTIDNSGKLYAITEVSGTLSPQNLFVSADNGKTWQQIDSILGSTVIMPNGTIYTSGMDATFEMYFRRSDDGGKTWSNVVGPRTLSMTSPGELANDQQGNLYFRQHAGDTLFVSHNGGTTWAAFDGEQYSRVFIDPTGDTYFVYDQSEVYWMKHGSTEKTRIINGLPFNGQEITIVSIVFSADNTPYLSHSNGRIYKLTETTTDINESPEQPIAAHAYPNPFTERLAIRVNLPNAADFTVKLFDILGNEVQTVMTTQQSSGTTLFIDGSTLVPGIYTYQIVAGTRVQSGAVVRR